MATSTARGGGSSRRSRRRSDEGEEGSLPYALSHLPQVELWSGKWARAEGRALEHLELAETHRAVPRAADGDLPRRPASAPTTAATDEDHTSVEEALPEASDQWCVYQLCSVLGFIELSAGRYADAVAPLRRARRSSRAAGHSVRRRLRGLRGVAGAGRRPGRGRADCRGVPTLGAPDKQGERAPLSRPMAGGEAGARRSDLRAGRGARAPPADQDALRTRPHVADPRPGASSARGAKAARDALSAAITTFDELGAPLWAERATAELGRVPIRRAADRDGLTATEERVAKLVAGGRTNKEVAQELFLSVKTVESNLTRIYRKLGVRSRSALAAGLAAREEDAASAKP